MSRRVVALTIAGSDSSGGAGVAADLKTFEALGVWGTCAITAVTAQNSRGVQAWEPVSAELVQAQIAAVTADLDVAAAKTGMLGTADVVRVAAVAVKESGVTALVVDPVFVATTGASLSEADAVLSLRAELLPLAMLVTPNLAEAAALAGCDVPTTRAAVEEAARRILDYGPGAVLVTGGHLGGEGSPDCLLLAGGAPEWLEGVRVDSPDMHGSGCVLSAAITAELARGMDLADACVAGKRFVERAIAAGVALGAGAGPVDPGWERAT